MSIYTTTENGALALKNTGNSLVDLFFSIGALRPSIAKHSTKLRKDKSVKDTSNATEMFSNALLTDPEYAAAILLWARDIRHGGAGEREVFKVLFSTLVEADETIASKVLDNIIAVGRFDDLKVAYGTSVEAKALELWASAMRSGNVLAFKWADRSDTKLRSHMGMKNEAEFRKYISAGRKNALVEQAMCSKEWKNIEYSKLPSVAGARYAKSFKKNDEERYISFLGNKETKVNTSTVYPHDVYRTYLSGQREAASKYWENMPKLELKGNVLVIADVSGSMDCQASGSIRCLDISISLGTYLAQQCQGAFNGKLMTFSKDPTMVTLPTATSDIGTLFCFVRDISWGANTDFEKTYKQILDFACLYNVPQEQMPDYLLCLSDMQFDESHDNKDTHFNNMKSMFETKGYKLPKIIFWNLNSAYKNVPVSWKNEGVCLVSGFSPNILKAVLSVDMDKFTPFNIMDEAIQPFVKMLNNSNKQAV